MAGGQKSCSKKGELWSQRFDGVSTHDETLEATLKQLIADTHTLRMLKRRQGIFDHVFHVQRGPYLVEDRPHISDASIGEHYKLQLRGRLEVVHLVFSRAI